MVSALTVGNTILVKARDEGVDMTPMKLQKMLYILYKEYLQKTGRPLFPERFEVWKYGPVLSGVHNAFKKYGSNRIRSLYRDADGSVYVLDEESSPVFREVLDCIWKRYGRYSGIRLAEMTHRKDTAWYRAAVNHRPFLAEEDILAEEAFL